MCIRDSTKEDGSNYNLYLDGLKIYTTINYEMQQYAEEAVKEHMPNLQKEFFLKTQQSLILLLRF